MRPELTPRFVQPAFVPSHVRQRAVRPVLAGIRALIVASAMCLAPVVFGSSAQAQDASEARAGLIRIEWPGGTLEEFVKAVQATSPKPWVNVVLLADDAASASVRPVRIPPMSVRDVAPTTLFRSLVHMAPTGCEILVNFTEDTTGDAVIATEPIITIRARRVVGAAEAAAEAARPSVAVIDLSVYLSGDGDSIEGGPAKERLDRLMDAVGAALTLDDRPVVAAQLRIHAPTGLLFVKGDEGQVSLVNEVIERIVAQQR
jgi:hypothetical protein